MRELASESVGQAVENSSKTIKFSSNLLEVVLKALLGLGIHYA